MTLNTNCLSIHLPKLKYFLLYWSLHFLELINIDYRFHAHESINNGRGNGIFSFEEEQECGEGCDCEKHEYWGYDINTCAEVNLLEHFKSGKTRYDEQWNVVSG